VTFHIYQFPGLEIEITNSMTLLEIEITNSMTLQVFHDLYKAYKNNSLTSSNHRLESAGLNVLEEL